MRDYRIKKEQDPHYILQAVPIVTEEEGKRSYDTFDVYFADGIVFHNQEYTEQNMKKVERKQEEQVDEGIKNLPIFKRRLTISGVINGASAVLGTIVATNVVPALEQATQTESKPGRILCTAGVLTLLGLIPSAISLVKTKPIVSELTKLQYRNEHRDKLDHFDEYENALVGLSDDVADGYRYAKEDGEDPFSVVNIDSFTQEDMESIVSNIEREEKFGFTYVKKPTSTEK